MPNIETEPSRGLMVLLSVLAVVYIGWNMLKSLGVSEKDAALDAVEELG